MGDRANIAIKYEEAETPIYFYTHWDGSSLEEILAEALARGESRWDDPVYLARIIFCEMIRDNVTGTTGYGISPYPAGDAQHEPLVVDTEAQTVNGIPFKEFVKTRERRANE